MTGPDNLTRWIVNRLKDQLSEGVGRALEQASDGLARAGARALATGESEAVAKAKELVADAGKALQTGVRRIFHF